MFLRGVHCVPNVKKGTLGSHWINYVNDSHLVLVDIRIQNMYSPEMTNAEYTDNLPFH